MREEQIRAGEVTYVGELPVTTVARTALDLAARFLPRDIAVAHLDALACATGVSAADAIALAARYPGARGIRRARVALALMDGGAVAEGNVAAARPNRWRVTKAANPDQGQ